MAEHNRRPNLILFTVDQLSAKWLEAASSGVVPTPNLDRLRATGVTFTRAFTSNPVCCASRATLATGLTTRGHGVLENGYQLNPELPTFMKALQKSGYQTGALGKVHLQPHFRSFYPDYTQYGFDEIHITEDSRGGEWLDWVEREHPEHYKQVLATIWSSSEPEYEKYGPRKVNLKKQIDEVRANFKWATDRFPQNNPHSYTLPFPEFVSQTAWITSHAEQFIRKTKSEKPFFAHISYVQPHGPYCAPEEYMDRVKKELIPKPLPATWKDDPNMPKCFPELEQTDRDIMHARHCYFADIAHLDDQLGRIYDTLEETGNLENTYIIFLSDHGDLLGDHGFFGKEHRHYDSCIRVPLVLSGPGIQHGQKKHEFVLLEDIAPTCLDLCSAELPPMPKMGPYLQVDQRDIPSLPGSSLINICQGKDNHGHREHAYSESYNTIWSADPAEWARTIRTARFRYTYYPNGTGEQLFDLRSDPDEQNNLVDDPKYGSIRSGLRDQLLDEIISQDYPKTRRDLYALGVH